MFTEDHKITTVAAVANGTSAVTGVALDMSGYEEATFIIRLGTPAANNSVKITQCDTSGGSYADLTGTSVAHATGTPLIINVRRPVEQFLKYVITRGTSTTVDIACIIQSGARNRPVTQPTGTQVERHGSPVEGTA